MRKVRLFLILLLTSVIVVAFIAAYQLGYLDFLSDAAARPVTALTISPQEDTPASLPTSTPTVMSTGTATPSPIPSPTATHTPMPSNTPTEIPPTPLGQSGNWTLLFSDEFNGSALNTAKWTPCYWWAEDGCTNGSSGELEWYVPQNVLIQDGTLRLRAEKQKIQASDGKTHPYISGMVSSGRDTDNTSTPARFAFQYGYAEIRARIPAGKGLWPAFWMLPITQKSLPEIDIMEVLGHAPDVVEMHVHARDGGGQEVDEGIDWQGPDFSSDWHTFAVDWQPDSIVWYVDGVARWHFSEQKSIPAEPMYLLLNLAVGGTWPGNPNDATTFPSEFAIDYVRVWAHK